MSDPAQLPHLVALLEDEDAQVRTVVLENLAAFGETLEQELRMLPCPPDEDRIRTIVGSVRDHSGGDTATAEPEDVPRVEHRLLFQAGDLVRHRRYGYRGVIVQVDLSCQAPEVWYQNNRTKPPRNQPWYHVLVHGTNTITYAAQTSMKSDESGRPVRHPLVRHFFGPLVEGRYRRNNRPWPQR